LVLTGKSQTLFALNEIINNQSELTGRSAVGQQMITTGMQFCPCGLAPYSFVALPLVCPLPPTSWFMVGPCVQVQYKNTCSPLRIQCDRYQGTRGGGTCGRLPWLPSLIAFCPNSLAYCLLCCQLAPTLQNIADQQVNFAVTQSIHPQSWLVLTVVNIKTYTKW